MQFPEHNHKVAMELYKPKNSINLKQLNSLAKDLFIITKKKGSYEIKTGNHIICQLQAMEKDSIPMVSLVVISYLSLHNEYKA